MRSALQSPLSGETVGHFTCGENTRQVDAVEENPPQMAPLRYAAALSEHFTKRRNDAGEIKERAIYMQPELK